MAHVKHWASDLLSWATYKPTCVCVFHMSWHWLH